jgi:hypothetical protein
MVRNNVYIAFTAIKIIIPDEVKQFDHDTVALFITFLTLSSRSKNPSRSPRKARADSALARGSVSTLASL